MGAAIASHFASSGFSVVVSDIDAATAQATSDQINRLTEQGRSIPIAADVTDSQDVERMISRTVDAFDTISVLVNNAGILFPTPIDQIGEDEWNTVLGVNLTGTFLCSKSVIPVMKDNSYGRIINMSSSAGRSVSTLGGAHYTAAKAGVLGLTRAMAKELAPHGILVNAICPGLIDTQMVRDMCDAKDISEYEKTFPMGRLGTVDEVAKVALVLCKESMYIAGAAIDVNGGDLMI